MRFSRIALAAWLIAGCRGSGSVSVSVSSGGAFSDAVPAGAVSVKAFGARGDGVTDDRVAIQAALDAAAASGQELYLPVGTYSLSQAPRGYFALQVHGNVHLVGADRDRAVLRQAPGTAASVRLMNISGEHVVLEDLTLDGNRAALPKNEQRHGIFVTDSTGLTVRRVTSRNFTGDGFYLFNGTKDARFYDVLATANGRNGLTLGGMVDGTAIVESKFIGNTAQQVDSEPGGDAVVSNTTITGSLLDTGGVSNQYVLTCSGTRADKPGHHWKVFNNTINGGVFVVWANHVVIAGNTGVNQSPVSFVTVQRSSSDVLVLGNRFVQAQRTVASLAGVLIVGTAGSSPERITIAGNDITMRYERSFGVRASGALSVQIIGNTLRGGRRAAAGFAGIHLRATNLDRDFRSAVVRGNDIRDFGDRGVQVVGNGQAKLGTVDISDNTFACDSASPSMTTGISLDDGTGAVQEAHVDGNKYLGGVRSSVINIPAHVLLKPRAP